MLAQGKSLIIKFFKLNTFPRTKKKLKVFSSFEGKDLVRQTRGKNGKVFVETLCQGEVHIKAQ